MFRANRERDLVRIISMRPRLQAAIIRLNSFLFFMLVPVIPSAEQASGLDFSRHGLAEVSGAVAAGKVPCISASKANRHTQFQTDLFGQNFHPFQLIPPVTPQSC